MKDLPFNLESQHTNCNENLTKIQIEKHKKTAMHLAQAAESHNKAALFYELGNHTKAMHCTREAQQQLRYACEAQTLEFM